MKPLNTPDILDEQNGGRTVDTHRDEILTRPRTFFPDYEIQPMPRKRWLARIFWYKVLDCCMAVSAVAACVLIAWALTHFIN